ncbi:translation initiation factor IF-2-like isoform X1 [Panthera uncia]|uniref:translation initiation factor IF-2-like isoform X1 n=1 Tax=Panthera uncia TaxID=29064 RepID=UPI0020FFD084|nr:translation initiation factor IF-2-like isoform X1 [Panthera uncia]
MRPAGPPKSRTPAAPLYPILPDSHDLLSLDPPPYHPPPLAPQALPAAAAPPVAPLVAPLGEPGGQEAAAAPDWGRREVAAAPEPGGREAAAAPSPIENETNREGPAGRTRGRTQQERERIQLEARKLVPGDDGRPTSNPDLINAAFPLTRPPQDKWDYNTAEGRGRLPARL